MGSFFLSLPNLVDIDLLEIAILRVPVVAETFDLFLVAMKGPAAQGFKIQVRISEADLEEYLLFEADREKRRDIKELMRRGTLQVVHDYTFIQMKEFVPNDLQPWNQLFGILDPISRHDMYEG
ncbi:hypothetical protein BDZ94DRAFT_1375931 [Collybia nuda]|uniref:Uncharacterized protein n=1 Tax=Collybia nuda TaxID=64659 RepID=A0A9P5Y1K3_9AGAR|nr:hypothetical protein BDZ94DRAFT_1375931 [Collybia nuda]